MIVRIAGVVLIALWLLFEGRLALTRRGRDADERDHATLPVFLAVWSLGVILALAALVATPNARLPASAVLWGVGDCLMLCGIALRLWSIAALGSLFTVRITIQPGHRVVDHGPYAVLRHPSYAALLLTVAGAGMVSGNYGSLLLLTAACAVGIVVRIDSEERELASALGDEYARFASSRKKLIPFVW